MARSGRTDVDGAWHHVMNRGRGRADIFYTDGDRRFFLSLLAKAKAATGVQFHAYALMSNHYHLLVHTPTAGLSDAMKLVGGEFVQRFNVAHRRDGSLCRGRFHSVLIDDEAYLNEVVRYIHNNPVKARLVESAGDYQWSSHRSYMRWRRRPSFLTTETILDGYFEGNTSSFAEFVGEHDSGRARRLAAAIEQGVLRDRLSDVFAELDGPFSLDHPSYRRVVAIERFVSRVTTVSPRAIPEHGVLTAHQTSAFAMALLHRLSIATTQQLADRFGYASRSGAMTAIARFERCAKADRALGRSLQHGLATL